MTALLRSVVTALRGRVPCKMSMCGRPSCHYGFCRRHLHAYRYEEA